MATVLEAGAVISLIGAIALLWPHSSGRRGPVESTP